MKDLFVAKDSKKISAEDFAKQLESLENVIINDANSLGANGLKALKDVMSEASGKITGSSAIEVGFKNFTKEILGATGKEKITSSDKDLLQKTKESLEAKSASSSVFGGRTSEDYLQMKTSQKLQTQSTTNSGKVDVGGTITFKFDLPPGTTLNQQQLNAAFNSEEFKQYIVKLTEAKATNKNQGVVSYGK